MMAVYCDTHLDVHTFSMGKLRAEVRSVPLKRGVAANTHEMTVSGLIEEFEVERSM